jgi:hypothetical protein
MNSAVRAVAPDQVSRAIREDQSLWALGKSDIEEMAARIPPPVIEAGRPLYRKALAEYGTSTKLVLAWLSQDNPALHSAIVRTVGGPEWFDRQVREICGRLGLDYEL